MEEGQAAQSGGQDTTGYLAPGGQAALLGGRWRQDQLLHRLKLDTDEETNHLTELSRNKSRVERKTGVSQMVVFPQT